MKIQVNTPNGATIELEGDLTVEQIAAALSATGAANVVDAPVTERVVGDVRQVTFGQPTGTTKG